MAIYGAIPLLHAHSASSTVGLLNLVGSETWIDVSHPTEKSTKTQWISESGILDVFLLPGPTPNDVFKQYAALTGPTALPPEWSLAYHQCRWNYLSSDDVRTVAKRFDENDLPVDVLWLDIDYAEDHKYFVWKEKEFPDPVQMTNDIAAIGRKVRVQLMILDKTYELLDRWSSLLIRTLSACSHILCIAKHQNSTFLSNPRADKVSLRAGVGVAVALGSISSTHLVGNGGRLYSNTAVTAKIGIGQTALMTFSYGTI